MYILFDIGGTKMRVASSRDGKTLDTVRVEKTIPHDFEEGMRVFETMVSEIAGAESIEHIVGGIAGPLNREKTRLVNAPHMSGWIDKPLGETLKARFKSKVSLENDAALVGLGEAVFGAGQNFSIVAYITISTGVGGARIVDGAIDKNVFGFEPGHHIMQMGDGVTRSRGGGMGDFESFVSGTSLSKRAGKHASEIPRNDPLWDECARYLAIGLNNVSVFWSPDVIVLGGAMITGDPHISLEKTEEYFKEIMHIFPERSPLKKAELEDKGGLYGALAFLQKEL